MSKPVFAIAGSAARDQFEAATMLGEPLSLTVADPVHSVGETLDPVAGST